MKSDRLAEQHKIVRAKLEEFTTAINDKLSSDNKVKVDLSNLISTLYPKSSVPEFKETFNALVAHYNSSISFISKPPTSNNLVVTLQRKKTFKDISALNDKIEKIITGCKNYTDEKLCNDVLESINNLKALTSVMQEGDSNSNEKKLDNPPTPQS